MGAKIENGKRWALGCLLLRAKRPGFGFVSNMAIRGPGKRPMPAPNHGEKCLERWPLFPKTTPWVRGRASVGRKAATGVWSRSRWPSRRKRKGSLLFGESGEFCSRGAGGRAWGPFFGSAAKRRSGKSGCVFEFVAPRTGRARDGEVDGAARKKAI